MKRRGKPIENTGLAKLCDKHGYRIKDLAAYAGVHRNSIRFWINGRPSPLLERKLADLFGITPAQLRRRVFPLTRKAATTPRSKAVAS